MVDVAEEVPPGAAAPGPRAVIRDVIVGIVAAEHRFALGRTAGALEFDGVAVLVGDAVGQLDLDALVDGRQHIELHQVGNQAVGAQAEHFGQFLHYHRATHREDAVVGGAAAAGAAGAGLLLRAGPGQAVGRRSARRRQAAAAGASTSLPGLGLSTVRVTGRTACGPTYAATRPRRDRSPPPSRDAGDPWAGLSVRGLAGAAARQPQRECAGLGAAGLGAAAAGTAAAGAAGTAGVATGAGASASVAGAAMEPRQAPVRRRERAGLRRKRP